MLFTICGTCGIFAVTLIWLVQNYFQLLSCLVVSFIAIYFCMVSLTLTSLGFSMYRINWPAWWQGPFHLLAAFHCFVLFIQLLPLRNIWRHISLTWPFPIDTVIPHGLLMLRNCFLNFAVKHWFVCHATEPSFTEDNGAIEVWLIDWFIEMRWFTQPGSINRIYGGSAFRDSTVQCR